LTAEFIIHHSLFSHMDRRNAFKYLSMAGLLPLAAKLDAASVAPKVNIPEREYWIALLVRIATPLLEALSKGELKKTMPVECHPGSEATRHTVTYLEAFGRLMAGMAPWLALGPDGTAEGQLREKMILLAQKSLKMAVDPLSPDFMNFTVNQQPLVDQGLLVHCEIHEIGRQWIHCHFQAFLCQQDHFLTKLALCSTIRSKSQPGSHSGHQPTKSFEVGNSVAGGFAARVAFHRHGFFQFTLAQRFEQGCCNPDK